MPAALSVNTGPSNRTCEAVPGGADSNPGGGSYQGSPSGVGATSAGSCGGWIRFVIGSAVALVIGAMGLIERHLKTTSSFAIESVEVTGNQQLTAARVISAAGLAVG